ncbi:hypothetical protein OL239_00230 [Arthrobacter sp. ATA002]|nr:IclR family transcriptional regulator C-terminal domain-containing protein [Arthrobacter sp. ATA002]WAP53256.1 hypothetical protein OL239_00230 [Arthrobacter sp. ATA002]
MASRVGMQVPMYSTASGAAYLSLAGPAAFEAVVARGMPPLTPATPSTRQELQAVVDLALNRGYAIDDMANEDHIRGIAAAIVDASHQPVAALSIVGPEFNVTPARFELLGSLAVAAARRISARLGARHSITPSASIKSSTEKERI